MLTIRLAPAAALLLGCVAASAQSPPCPDPQPPVWAEAEDGAVAKQRGLLWRIDRPGIPPSHVFGTIHLDDPRVTTLPEPVTQALQEARSVVVEIELHPAARATLQRGMRTEAAEQGLHGLDEGLLLSLIDIARDEYGIRAQDLETVKPWALFTILSRPPAGARPTQDEIIQDYASKQGIPVHGLESAAELIATLDGISRQDQLEILRDTICQRDEILQQTETLIAYYLDRDLTGIASLNAAPHHDQAVFERFIGRVLHERNQRMLARLSGNLHEGGVFVAVGALHLTGDDGLLVRLTGLGYTVTAVY